MAHLSRSFARASFLFPDQHLGTQTQAKRDGYSTEQMVPELFKPYGGLTDDHRDPQNASISSCGADIAAFINSSAPNMPICGVNIILMSPWIVHPSMMVVAYRRLCRSDILHRREN